MTLFMNTNDKCIVCENDTYTWTDLNGEVGCDRCGTPYVLGHGININDMYFPFVKRYWAEVKQPVFLGTYMPIQRNKTILEKQDSFFEWLEKQPDHPTVS